MIVGDPDGAMVSTVHVQLADGPLLPAASAIRTWKVCEPSASWPVCSGVAQANHAPLSSRHWKVSGDVAPAKAKVGFAEASKSAGFVVNVGAAAGAVRSTVQVVVAAGPALPAASTSCTLKECEPSASVDVVRGEVHDVQAPPSSWQAYVSPLPAPVKAIAGVAWLSGFGGVLVNVGALDGAVRSTVHVYDAADPPLPAASTRRTENVWVPSASVEVVVGEVHAVHAPASTRHWYVSPAPAPANVNCGVGELSGLAGAELIVGVPLGAVTSTVNEREVAVPPLPAVSAKRTSKTCAASLSPVYVFGEVHAAHAPASTWHW